MFIAVDGMSTRLPEDVQALGAQALGAGPVLLRSMIDRGETHGGGPAETLTGPSPSAAALDRWDVQSHQYTTKVEVEASVLARLISGKTQVSHYGLVQEAKRFCIQTSKTGRRIEFGTAVRLSVAVLSTQFDAALTLPNIAAKAQLTDLRARIALSVDGYVGPLGELLPAPDNLNVENLAIYTTAFKAIQAQVFGAAGLDHIAPTLLGYDDDKEDQAG
jgi:hypothetical protein